MAHQPVSRVPSAAKLVKQHAEPTWQKRIFLFFGAAIGVAIGFTFEKGKIYLPAVIKAQMVFEDFSMMKMFLTGTAVGMFAVALLLHVRLQNRAAVKLALGFNLMRGYGANVIGGLVMGFGITVAGACPGTMLAQLGAGVPYAAYTVAGGLAGAVIFTLLHGALQDTSFHRKREAALLDEHLGMHILQISVVFAAAMMVVIAVIEYFFPWSATLKRHVFGLWSPPSWLLDPYAQAWHPVTAGAVMGLLQNIAVSSTYVMAAGALLRLVIPNAQQRLPYLQNFYSPNDYGQLGSTLGIVAGAFLSLRLSGVTTAVDSSATALSSFVGGFLVLIGARLAGGCASGHGLSGIARLSSASLLTSACMFVGAIGSGMAARLLF